MSRIVFSLAFLAGCATHEPEAPTEEVLPDRFIEMLLESPPAQEPAAAHAVAANPDAGEGAKAKREEGKVGKSLDRQIAENSGVLGGLVGTSGTQIGSGGLGARGGGLGGGGAMGGLGATGMGSGSSGYGKGGGNFGSVPLAQDWRDVGHNPVELAQTDFLSTFSIDVDTGAYTQGRRIIRDGQIPPAASVRTEEYVNYLDYVYPQPDDGQAFSITMEAAPHPWTAGHHVLRVGIQGDRLERNERPPVHLTFLVDVSGSMNTEDKLPLAQQALHHLVDNLEGDDTVAIATYAGGVARILEPTSAANKLALHSAIDRLRSGGGTGMESGMVLAYDMAERAHVPGHESRVLVLSDGDANIGRASPEQILEALAHHAGEGITLSTVGFGTGNYRDTMMEPLADKGDGNYVYIDNLAEAHRVFGSDITATLQTIARDVKIQVEFDREDVLAYKLIGYENRAIADEDFRNDAVDAGEVGAGHNVTALYDVVLRDHLVDDIATVRVRYKAPGADVAARERVVGLPALAIHPTFLHSTRDLRLAWGSASFAEKLRGASEMNEVEYADIALVVRNALRSDTERDDELLSLITSVDGFYRAVAGG